MSQLSDVRYNCASRAVIESHSDLSKAHVLAERYYHSHVGRELSMGEVHDLASLVAQVGKKHSSENPIQK
ncbi:hypothetical protein P886_4704 [Alteromonadaceae bacterium 2753L.S.0a.02]|nr:hypothetical protein P886_4704 [Alteromonadaceae bacterium 2753L.S.0a.02]